MPLKDLPHIHISLGHALEAKNGNEPEYAASNVGNQRHAAKADEKGDEGRDLNEVAFSAQDKNASVQRAVNGYASHNMAPEKEKSLFTIVGAKAMMVMMNTTPNKTFTMPLSSSPLVNQ